METTAAAGLASTALALAKQDWSSLGLDNGDPITAPTSDFSVLVERATALLFVRCAAIVASPGEYSDYSTITICQKVLARSKDEDNLLLWPTGITEQVVFQLETYARSILSGYKDVPYHNREHAFHVMLSANKLIDLMIQEENTNLFGLRQDPLMLFGLVFAALIHDVEHQGVPNRQLVVEDDELAVMYNDQSIAENRSLSIGFAELLKDDYKDLRQVLFFSGKESSYLRFRTKVVDLVLTTDIASTVRMQIAKSKWKEAFGAISTTKGSIVRQNSSDTMDTIASTIDQESNSPVEMNQSDSVERIGPDFVAGKTGKKKKRVSGIQKLFRRRQGNNSKKQLVGVPEQRPPTKDSADKRSQKLKGSLKAQSFRKRLGILQSMDLSGEALPIYHMTSSSNLHPDKQDNIHEEPDEFKASVVLEIIMTAADVAQNLQGFDQMTIWSGHLYKELRQAYLNGRGSDPQVTWYENQIGFLQSYVFPLARHMDNTGVFGETTGKLFRDTVVSSCDRWVEEGKKITEDIVAAGKELKAESASSMTTELALRMWGKVFTAVLVFVMLQTVHLRLSRIIQKEELVPPGTWLSRCGLLGIATESCENAFLNVDSNGLVTIYNADLTVACEIGAGSGPSTQDTKGIDRGMIMNGDRTLQIDGKRVNVVDAYVGCRFVPWPFANEPKAKTRYV